MDMKRFFLYFMVIAALALAGCGGNGGGTTTPDPDPAPPMSYDVTVPATVTLTAADMEPFTGTKTVGDVTFTCPSGSSCTLTQDDDGAITATGGQVTADFSQAYKDRMNAAAMAMHAAINLAIADPDGDKDMTEGLQKAERPGNGTTIVVTSNGRTTVTPPDADGNAGQGTADILGVDDMTNDESNENQFMKMDSATRATLNKFTYSVHERTIGKKKDTLTVYTNMDQDPPAYSKYYTTANEPNVITTVGIASIAAAANNGTRHTITFASDVSTIGKYIKSDNFPTGDTASVSYESDDPATTDTDEETGGGKKFSGTFHGIPGEFVCTAGQGTACTATNNKKGILATFTETWTFKPTVAGARMPVMGTILDTDFLTFGYWLQSTENDDGSMKYQIDTFATGADVYEFTALQDTDGTGEVVFGSATYAGKATGMYAKSTFSDKGEGSPSASGQFTADANLTAYFGGDDVAVNNQYSISGTVNNIRDTSGMPIDSSWTVKLNKAGFGASGNTVTAPTGVTAAANTFYGTTTGGGGWQGQFFGLSTVGTATSGRKQPTGVAGEFNGHFTNGHVIGAFGATEK